MSPKQLVGLEKEDFGTVKNLHCPNCNFELAVPYIYEKENRPAFRVYQDAITKTIRKLND